MSRSGRLARQSDSCKRVPISDITPGLLRLCSAINSKLQLLGCCAELQGLGTFLTLEELTKKDESLLQQVQGVL